MLPEVHVNLTWNGAASLRLMNNCLHVRHRMEHLPGGAATFKSLDGYGMRKAFGPPERALEHYGEIAKVKVTEQDRIEVELRAYTPMCCSHPFTAAISRDGNALVGDWPGGQNQAPRSAT